MAERWRIVSTCDSMPMAELERELATTLVEQPMAPKMRPRSGALVMNALLVLNKRSAVAHEVDGHRTAP